jgi:hypothetical protein
MYALPGAARASRDIAGRNERDASPTGHHELTLSAGRLRTKKPRSLRPGENLKEGLFASHYTLGQSNFDS